MSWLASPVPLPSARCTLRERYYAEVYGTIFVLDAADHSRMDEAKAVLHEAISDVRIRGKPLLVFANKQDVEGALPADAVAAGLGLVGGGPSVSDSEGGASSSSSTLPEQFNIMACTAKIKAHGGNGDVNPRPGVAQDVDRCDSIRCLAPLYCMTVSWILLFGRPSKYSTMYRAVDGMNMTNRGCCAPSTL